MEITILQFIYWVNFAYTGDPNGFLLDDFGEPTSELLPAWEKRTESQDKLLQFDTEVKMVDDPNMEIYKVIDKFMDSRVSE